MYIVKLFFTLKNRLLGLIGRPEELTTGKFGKDNMKFEFVNYAFQFLMDVSELAITQFSSFGLVSLIISDLQHIDDLTVLLGLVVDDLGLQVNHPC